MEDVVERFQEKTGYDLKSFMLSYADFIDTDKQAILDFYAGYSDELKSTAVKNLDYLIDESSKIDSLFISNKEDFSDYSYWELIDTFSDIVTSLNTINKASKWLRSSTTNSSFNPSVEVDMVLKQNQTLESLAREIGYDDPDNDWIDIANRNELEEEDYTPDGNTLLSVSFQNALSINVKSIVDNIQGLSIYGLDIQRKLEFDETENDLKVLSYQDTINQAFEILIELKRGDVPEFPNDGIQASLVIGSNIGSVAYPSIFRQLFEVFSKDDTFSQITILNVSQKDSHVELGVGAKSRLDDFFKDKIAL